MNVKILRKLSNRVRIKKDGRYWIVESRGSMETAWKQSPTYSSLKKALNYKHNLTQRLIRDMGYFSYFKERRIKKFNRFRRKNYDLNGLRIKKELA